MDARYLQKIEGMKRTIHIAFADFAVNWGPWPDPVKYFKELLSEEYDVHVVSSDFGCRKIDGYVVDLVICSHPGTEHENFHCPKVYFPGEPNLLNLESYQYAITHHFSDDSRQYRLPLYALYGDVDRLVYKDSRPIPPKFCCVLFGKAYPHVETPREDFFDRLCSYKNVHSAGKYLNNTGFVITPRNKAEFIKDYKFVLSFESCSLPGFTSEKVFEPLLMNTIPVYWGNPLVHKDFNTKSFINANEYKTLDNVIERVIELDKDEDAYLAVLREPAFVDNVVNEYVKKENLLKFFRQILE